MKLRNFLLFAIVATLLVSFTPSYSAQPDSIITTEGKLDSLLEAKKLKSATRLVIVGSLNDADFRALRQMSSLTHLDISHTTITDLPEYAFEGCGNLETIELPNNIKSIGLQAFRDCRTLTSIVIPQSVTSIEEGAFSSCNAVTSTVIPEGVTSIGDWAFSDCSSLVSITVSPKNTTYKDIDGVLYSKDGETLIAYPAGKSTASYVIQSTVTSIEWGAFYDCSSLTSIVILDGVTSIEGYAFSGCSTLTSIVIPNSVTSIGESAFYECSSLTSVVIPQSVTSIGDWAFSNCRALTKVTCLATTPPELDWAVFGGFDKVTRELAVPAGSVKAYEEDEYWRSNFKHIKAIQEN